MKYDVIIIGSGAGGSAAAYHLTQTGKRVLVVEKGLPLAARRQHARRRHGHAPRRVPQQRALGRSARRNHRARGALQPRRQDQVVRRGAAALRAARIRRRSGASLPGVADRLRGAGAVLRRSRSSCSVCARSAAEPNDAADGRRAARLDAGWRQQTLMVGLATGHSRLPGGSRATSTVSRRCAD